MKTLLGLAALVSFSAPAFAADAPLAAVLHCRVSEITGNLGSFVPPAVGDEITIDTSANSISELRFSGRAMIPVQQPLVKKTTPATVSYIASYQSPQYASDTESGVLTVAVGIFNQPEGKVAMGWIQEVTTDLTLGLVTTANVSLSCAVR